MGKSKDLEFAIDDAGGRQRVFGDFNEAAAFAVVLSSSNGRPVNLDVLIHSRLAAKIWGGDDALEQYEDDPDASVSERFIIRAESVGRIA